MEIGGEKFYVDKGVVLIPKGEFHRVQNRSRDSELAFISVFPGKRKDSNALYSRDGEGSAAARDRTTQYRGSSRIG